MFDAGWDTVNGKKTSQRASARTLKDEIRNFHEIVNLIKGGPEEYPRLTGYEFFGATLPLAGENGGDHIIYVDFNERYDLDAMIRSAVQRGEQGRAQKLALNRHRAGVLIADVSGHRMTDAFLTGMLHQSFLLGVAYELEMVGEVSTHLFEMINTRFFHSSSIRKLVTMLYAEIDTKGQFLFISAGHPLPLVFSRKLQSLVHVESDNIKHYPPIGTMPSKGTAESANGFVPLGFKDNYTFQEYERIQPGDILILCTDGVTEHVHGTHAFVPDALEQTLREHQDEPADQIGPQVLKAMRRMGPFKDDISLVLIKHQP